MTDLPNEKKKFMREKIVKPPVSKREIAGRIFCLFLCAVIFGIVAAVSFVLSRPVAEKYFGKKPPEQSIPITIERDDEPGASTASMETMEETTAPEVQYEAALEEVEQIVRRQMENYSWTTEKAEDLNQVLRQVGQDADKSIVTISSVKHQVDWFDNPVESSGQYAGIILAVNANEIVILTEKAAVEEADSLEVTFSDGATSDGVMKQKDSVNGLAVLSVAASELSESTRDGIEAIELGNSYSVRVGDIIVAVGSPAGLVHSVKRGAVSYVAKGVQAADSQTRVLYMDFDCNTEKGTFFLNLSGQLVGWATDIYGTAESQGITMAMPVSEYKGSLQKLSNGIAIPYLGIKGQEVTESMQQEQIPQGIYITESIPDGPAYLSGIQNGDILTKIQGEEITSIRDFQSCLENLEAGAETTVVIQRKGIDEYKEIEYNVIIGAR